ncbi:MAG: T9SS type A sorting domain-containing protein [Saprospiraceae bacterium]|nr:T9SS type A sorting domain-containing protein [Saprospiraceae bacterium]
MRSIFTKSFIFMLFGFLSTGMSAQTINTLTVTAPGDLAGEYKIIKAAFGTRDNTPFSGTAAFTNDGSGSPTFACVDAIAPITGLVGFADRGTCNFSQKGLNIQNAGAIAVIICNNTPATPDDIFSMAAGDFGASVTIPSFMLSYGDCQKLRAAIIAGGVEVSFSNVCDVEYDDEVFWGNMPGQGDFNGGLNEWTVDNPADLEGRETWYYTETGFPKSLFNFSAPNDIKSASQCNGAAAMDLFSLQEEDNPELTQPYIRYTAGLISPIIDCSGQESVILEFTMLHNRLNGNAQLSFNDGSGWSPAIVIPTENVTNTTVNPETVSIPIPSFANKPNCQVAFIVSGDFYYFVLDDVKLINRSFSDIKVNDNFYSVSPQLRTPASQVSEIPLLADIENIGNVTAGETELRVEFRDGMGNLLETLYNDYGDVPGTTLVENKPFAETYTPPAVEGFYNASYIIEANDDESDANNKLDFFFEITDKTYGNLLPEAEVTPANYMRDIAAIWNVGPSITNYYSGGNVYYVVSGEDYTVKNVRFGLANDINNIDGSGFIIVDLYEWQDLNGDGSSSADERELVGTNSIFIDASGIENARMIEAPIWAPDSAGDPDEGVRVTLKDNTTYLLMAHTNPFDAGTERYQFLTYSGFANTSFNRSIYHPATNYAFDTLGIDRRAGTLWDIEGVDGSYEDIRGRSFDILGNSATLFSFAMMYLEMDVDLKSNTYDFTNNVQVKTFPNPVSRDLYIDLTLENVSKNVKVDLFNIDGSLVMSKSFSNVQDERLRLDLSGVINGAYNVVINTAEGTVTKKVIVQK